MDLRRSHPGSKRRLAAVLSVMALGACGGSSSARDPGPAPQPSILRIGQTRLEMHTEAGVGQRTFGARPARIWAVLPSVFEALEIPVTFSEPRLRMGNSGYLARRVEGRRMSTYLDCGTSLASGVLADSYDITLQVLVGLRPVSETDTDVVAVVDALGRPRTTSGNPVHCNSKQVLEKRITELVAERLAEVIG